MTNDNAPRNEIASELRERVIASPSGATGLWFPNDEVDAIAGVLDQQEETISALVGGAAAMNEQADTLIAVIRLFRFYALGLISLPDQDKAREYLTGWIDTGNFRDLPWPDLKGPAGVLSNLGYVNRNGFVRRPLPQDAPKT